MIAALLVVPPPAAGAAGPEPSRTLRVSGAGVASYPAFDPATERYAVTGAEGAQVRVEAITGDPDGRVLVDGVPHGSAADVVVTGEPGEEVSVIFDDADGVTAYSLVLLPDGFPTLEAETAPGAELTPGLVLLTLSSFSATEASPFFETAVDRNGVPAYVRREASTSSGDRPGRREGWSTAWPTRTRTTRSSTRTAG